ncbi:hypothetical protein GALL_35230 [mine drainage metagenome]|uniref:Cthe-2314-like HEPN domain-containing protein n=1 Tax=mine drainage metagenome TaxID=410659 RepID=A0A1J5T7B8_9ZZZZ
MNTEYTITADFEHLAIALKSFWKPFEELQNEMDSFVVRPLSDFEDMIKAKAEKIQKLNPAMSGQDAYEYSKREVSSAVNPGMQFWTQFSDRLMTMYVTVTLLSHALCEAEINTVLTTGLYSHGSIDQFKEIQKKELKEKWLNGPKLYCPTYVLNKGSAVFETLSHLNRQRNAWMHHKVELRAGNEKVTEGSNLQRLSDEDMVRWIKRYFSLPFDLAAHALNHANDTTLTTLLYTRKPIPTADAHK